MKKETNHAIRSAALSLSLSFTHTLVSARSLYIVYFRIGSLSTRNPPSSPLSYGPIVVFSPSLLPSPPESTAAPPQFSVSSEQRERVTIYSGDLRDRGSSALSSRCQPFLSPLPFSIGALSHQPLDRPSPDPLRTPPYSYHPFFSFLYLIAALFMPGPANKHMNARAFSRAHGREIPAAHTTLCPRAHARAFRRQHTVADGPRALSRLINSQRDDISRLFSLDPFSVPIAAETAEGNTSTPPG